MPKPPPYKPLAQRMRDVASAGHPRAKELTDQADAFEEASKLYLRGSEHSTGWEIHREKFILAWQGCCRLYLECTSPQPGEVELHLK